jgi:hypothetical protein
MRFLDLTRAIRMWCTALPITSAGRLPAPAMTNPLRTLPFIIGLAFLHGAQEQFLAQRSGRPAWVIFLRIVELSVG